MQRGAKEPTLVEIYWYNNVTDKFSGRVHVRKDRAEGLVLFERTDGDGSRTPWHGEFFPLDGGIRMRLDPSLKNQRDFIYQIDSPKGECLSSVSPFCTAHSRHN